jgi:hypothetical protein
MEDVRPFVLADALDEVLKRASNLMMDYFQRHQALFPAGHPHLPREFHTRMFAVFLRVHISLAKISRHRVRFLRLLESQYVHLALGDLKDNIEEILDQLVNISIDELEEWETDESKNEGFQAWLEEKVFSFQCHYEIVADIVENLDDLADDLGEVLKSYD